VKFGVGEILRKSVYKHEMWLKPDVKIGHLTWRPQ